MLFLTLRPKALTERRSRTFVSGAGLAMSSLSPGPELASLSAETVDMCVEALDVLRR